MKKLLLIILFIVIAYFFISKYSNHNLTKAISSCVIAQKRMSNSLDIEKVKKFCEEKIRKQRED